MDLLLSLLILVFGLFLGSFYNVCIYRIPRKESIIFPPSHCTNCCKQLKWRELIPIFSWVLLGGKCRYCYKRISYRYPLIELITGLLFYLLFLKFGLSGAFISHSILCSILIIVTFIDIEFQIIPNELVLIGAIVGIILILIEISVHWMDAIIGMFIGGGIYLIVAILSQFLLKKEGMGGGDIKLMAMIGLMIGWKLTIISILLSVYIGGLIGGLLLLLRIKKRGDVIPYGPFIAIGTILSIFFGNELILWYLAYF